MQDRQNARLDGHAPDRQRATRRAIGHVPMPRMTNTYMLAGARDPGGRSSASVKNGIYAVNFGGGQVDITSGKYVFSVHGGVPYR